MELTVELDKSKLLYLITNFSSDMDRVVRKVALDLATEAKEDAPVDTGFLKGSVQFKDERIGDCEAEVIVGAEYGYFVEEGTVNQEAQPFLGPAADRAQVSLGAAIEAYIKARGGS